MSQTIRTVQVAKHLGISPRELREKILTKVNFPGVKPSDREMTLAIASGIVRVASRMLKISCVPIEEAFGEGTDGDTDDQEKKSDLSAAEKKSVETKTPPKIIKRGHFSTLEKLRGIGAVSQGDFERKKKEEEEKKKKAEEQKKKEEEQAKKRKPKLVLKGKKGGKKSPGVMRKIEITPEEAEAARLRKEARDAEKQIKKEEEEAAMLERKLLRKKRQDQIFVKKEGIIEIPAMLTVKEFSEKIGVPVPNVISALVKNGMMATITQSIDFDTASIIAEELEVELKKEEENLSAEDLLSGDLTALLEDEPENLSERAPVIAVVGHVDHGKTSILDAIRKTKVTDGESGGITQHIGAYSITKDKKNLTFLDTPGHEAFTSMRARGAKTADIVILVVAADDGVKPQTIEAITHAKSAGATIIVAANKIDKESSNLDKLKGSLSENEIQVEDWGGTVPMVPVSATTGQGIDDLLEMIFLQAEMMELKANPKRLAIGTVIEAHSDKSLGAVATILVNTGTLKMRDRFILGSTWGRVKAMINEDGKRMKKIPPSGAVQISGIDELPSPGDIFQVLGSEKELKQKKQELEELKNSDTKNGVGIADIAQNIKMGNMKTLNLVVKADTTGSLEAIEQALAEIGNDEVGAKIIHGAVGGISENDVMMASAGKGIVISFHTAVSNSVSQFSEKEGVDIQKYEVIYKLIDDITDLLEGMLEPEIIETITGSLDVKGMFYRKGKRQIIGGIVRKGYFEHPSMVRIIRGEEELATVKLSAIQHFEEKVRRIESPQECGLEIEGYMEEILEGDRIEGVSQKTILRKLERN